MFQLFLILKRYGSQLEGQLSSYLLHLFYLFIFIIVIFSMFHDFFINTKFQLVQAQEGKWWLWELMAWYDHWNVIINYSSFLFIFLFRFTKEEIFQCPHQQMNQNISTYYHHYYYYSFFPFFFWQMVHENTPPPTTRSTRPPSPSLTSSTRRPRPQSAVSSKRF